MARLIMLRHGKSVWNKHNLFTGWVDIPLAEEGVEEAYKAGEQIKDIPIDIIFTSTLVRAHMTLFLALNVHSSKKTPVVLHEGEGKLETWAKVNSEKAAKTLIPVIKAWELNERMYGDLQGVNKAEMMKKFGEEQVKIWRRSYDTPPPNGESLEMTAARAIPYFNNKIVPHLKAGKNVFVCAHGNSLRSIIMELEGLSKEGVVSLELETGVPIQYEYTPEGILEKI